ncbi:HEAT repeat domain-containing protein [Acidobacteriota bacterium]
MAANSSLPELPPCPGAFNQKESDFKKGLKMRSIESLLIIFVMVCVISSLSCSKTDRASIPDLQTNHAKQNKETEVLLNSVKQGGDLRKEARSQLIAMGQKATPELIKNLESSDFIIRWEIVNIFGMTKEPHAVEALVDRVLKDDNSHVRWRALWALTQIDDPAIPDRLQKALQTQKDKERWNAAVGCSMFGVREALPFLHENLKSSDEFTAWEAVNALSRMHDQTSVSHIRSIMKERGQRIRRECALTLGKMGYPEGQSALIEALEDQDSGVRWRAVMGLAKAKDNRVRKALMDMKRQEKDPEVLKHLNRALRS